MTVDLRLALADCLANGRGGACSSRFFAQEYHCVYMVWHNNKIFNGYTRKSGFDQLCLIFCNLTAEFSFNKIFGRSKPLPYREDLREEQAHALQVYLLCRRDLPENTYPYSSRKVFERGCGGGPFFKKASPTKTKGAVALRTLVFSCLLPLSLSFTMTENVLLIHRFAVPLPRWGRHLIVAPFWYLR